MTPTFLGRLQTRVFVIAIIGGIWTLIITPVLPGIAPGTPLSSVYRLTFRILAIVGVVGLLWECLYHFLQQFRWEKDWIALFGLLTGINEGIATWFIVNAMVDNVPGSAFIVHFATTWLVTWLWVNGPMRVLFLRWRFRGGRIL